MDIAEREFLLRQELNKMIDKLEMENQRLRTALEKIQHDIDHNEEWADDRWVLEVCDEALRINDLPEDK